MCALLKCGLTFRSLDGQLPWSRGMRNPHGDLRAKRTHRYADGWRGEDATSAALVRPYAQEQRPGPLDPVQLAEVIRVCRRSGSLSEAGRILFSASTARRAFSNDADRLRKYLHRYGIDWSALQATWSRIGR